MQVFLACLMLFSYLEGATASFWDDEMHAAFNINIPTTPRIVTTNEGVVSLSSL